MTPQVMVGMLRQGQTGAQILDILEVITSEFQQKSEVSSENEDVEIQF